ncbi:OTU domain-containing protein 3 [Galdieria sulphuraria]|nr:OTU domain-containing protein 3 [Galdieria sulphuraria]
MLILSKKRREENKRASLDSVQFPPVDATSPSPSERSFEDSSEDSPLLRERLSSLGLGIRTVEKDGNCLFSAVSDQLYGTPEYHRELRDAVCGFLQSHEEEYSSFVEDKDFQSYISDMRKLGTWAGNLELHAVSILYHVNVRIHCEDESFVDIVNFEGNEAKWIYLSYQHGEHYGSVREATDLQNSVHSSVKDVLESSPVLMTDPLIQSISRSHQISPKQVADWYSLALLN